ncbi:MAG: Rieske (2Fe-2S) protein [Oscillatoriales cyanobacterium]|nr:MAG: Rieske (2Fe-2S) protein [Oscillatoriales cyanobacterium]
MWVDVTALNQIPERDILKVKVEGISLILNRQGATHLEYPIDMGKVSNGIITCPFHKFQFKLDTGKCLNAPSDSLESYPVKIEGEIVFVDINES